MNVLREIRLTERDQEILEHVGTYRLTTREAVHRLWFDDSNINAVSKVLSKLVASGYLARHDLYGPGDSRAYYTYGLRSAGRFVISRKRCQPLGPQALISNFGMLGFCLYGKERRRRLSVREVHQKGENLLAKKLDSSRYFVQVQSRQLGLMVVDHGGSVPHLGRKCEQEVARRLRMDSFKQLIDTKRFVLGIATPTQVKADAIKSSMLRRALPVQVCVEVVPDLFHVIERNA
jgi:hypothetical protein